MKAYIYGSRGEGEGLCVRIFTLPAFKVLKSFPTASFGSKPDYSGFDCDSWSVRELSVHVQKVTQARNARTASERHALERSYGCKYLVPFKLPCCDIVCHHVVDPMHNLVW